MAEVKAMKRMLCSLVLLFAMSMTGLLVGSKSASADPVEFAGMEQELQGSNWEGTWETFVEGWSDGRAELSLTIIGDAVLAEISIYGGAAGNYTFFAGGTVTGNRMELKQKRSTSVLSLFKENGVLVLRGGYKVTSGEFIGETGSYYFKKK